MHAVLSQPPNRTESFRGMTNRQRVERYDALIERAQEKADGARSLAARRRYLNLILRLQRRALRELGRSH